MRSSKNPSKKKIINILCNTFRHLEESGINQRDPHLLVIKGHLVRSIVNLEDSSAADGNHSRKMVA